MGWNPVKKIKKLGKKVVGAHKAAVGGMMGSKKMLGSGLKDMGVGGKKGGGSEGAPKRERYKRKARNQWKSKSRKKFEASKPKMKGRGGLLGAGIDKDKRQKMMKSVGRAAMSAFR